MIAKHLKYAIVVIGLMTATVPAHASQSCLTGVPASQEISKLQKTADTVEHIDVERPGPTEGRLIVAVGTDRLINDGYHFEGTDRI